MDAPKEAKKDAVADDRAEPGIAGGFFAGKDAIHVLRRWARWALGALGFGLVLLGVGVYGLWAGVGLLRDLNELLREAIRHMK